MSEGSEPVLWGIGVALVTLFHADGSVDAEGTALHARRCVEDGARFVVVAGTTGEAVALDPAERMVLLRAVRDAVPDRPVVLGTGALETDEATMRLSTQAVDAGADGVLALAGADPVRFYRRLVAATDGRPVLAYHYPAWGGSVPLDCLAQVAEAGVAGLKDSSGDPERLLEELERFGAPVYVGSSAMLSFAGPLGCPGAILAAANIEAGLCIAAFAGDPGAQRQLLRWHRVVGQDFPRGLKAELARRFATSSVCRLA